MLTDNDHQHYNDARCSSSSSFLPLGVVTKSIRLAELVSVVDYTLMKNTWGMKRMK